MQQRHYLNTYGVGFKASVMFSGHDTVYSTVVEAVQWVELLILHLLARTFQGELPGLVPPVSGRAPDRQDDDEQPMET